MIDIPILLDQNTYRLDPYVSQSTVCPPVNASHPHHESDLSADAVGVTYTTTASSDSTVVYVYVGKLTLVL